MRQTKRPASERGRTKLDWLDSRHSFSFGTYQDPAHVNFRALRVINDDVVAPGKGFGEHGHRDAEILTYVLSGQLQHRDSMGNGSIVEAGDLQYMSAGSGVTHSEFNPSQREPVRFLQVWILPNQSGGAPRYADKALGRTAEPNALALVFSGEPRGEAIGIRADADVFVGRLAAGKTLAHPLARGHGAWIHAIRGEIRAAGIALGPGDGLAIEGAEQLAIEIRADSEFLLFDLA
jgi:hypothetical protein